MGQGLRLSVNNLACERGGRRIFEGVSFTLLPGEALVITGRNDTRCPKRQVDNYVAALEARGVPHVYDVFEAGHGSYAVDELIRQQALALDFLAEHLGTPAAQ